MNAKYRRGKWWYLRVPHPDGGSVVKKTKTTDKRTADAMERMVAELKERTAYHRLLLAIIDKRLTVPRVHRAWIDGPAALEVLIKSLDDIDLATLIDDWKATLVARFGATRTDGGETTVQYVRQVRELVTYAGGTLERSRFTAQLISGWLTSLGVTSGTRLRYHAAVSQFAKYCVMVGALERNIVRDVKAPRKSENRTRYLRRDEWTQLIDALEEPFKTAEALAHLGIEAGVIGAIRRRDVDLDARTIHVRGTKNRYRERMAYIYEWALPYVEAACRSKLPDAPIAPVTQRQLYEAHTAACEQLRIEGYRVHDARHSIAVWLVSAGTPALVVARQLGHKDAREVTERYGVYQPTAEDQARWERAAMERDAEREKPREVK